jgi:Zn-dependent protease with chaperone function
MSSSSGSKDNNSATDAIAHPPRLNPFAFVSDTGLRFGMLVVFVLAASILYWGDVAAYLTGLEQGLDGCLQGDSMFLQEMFAFEAERIHALFSCLSGAFRLQLPFFLGGLTLLLVATLAFYALLPVWIGYRWRASALPDDLVPGLSQELRALVARAGLRRPPLFLWNPLGVVPAGLAYGAFGRHRLAMSGALVVQFTAEPAVFRATVLHELAHLRNGDVTQAMLAVAVWRAFLATSLPPYLYVSVVDSNAFAGAFGLFQLTAITAVVLLTRNAVLRAREFYADARVVTWEPTSQGLARALERLEQSDGWMRFGSVHPASARRLRLLERTDELFRFSTWDAFGLGAATGFLAIVAAVVVSVGVLLAIGTFEKLSIPHVVFILLVPSVLVVVLGVGTVVIVTWRSAFQAAMRGRHVTGVLRVSLAFAAGTGVTVVGRLLPLLSPEFTRFVALPTATALLVLLLATVLVPLMGGVLALYLAWFAAAAVAWLPVLLRRRQPGAIFAAGLVLTCLLALQFPLFAAWAAVIVGGVGEGGANRLAATVWRLALIGSSYPASLIVWPSMIVLWAWPLAPALLAGRYGGAGVGGWAWLDPLPSEVKLPLTPLHPRRAALIGILGGLACGLVLSWIGQSLPAGWVRAVTTSNDAVPAHIRMMLVAIAAQPPLAALTVLLVPRLRTVHALFAVNVAGLVMAGAIWCHMLAQGSWTGVGPLPVLRFMFPAVVIGGVVLALPVALLVQGLQDLSREGATRLHIRHAA